MARKVTVPKNSRQADSQPLKARLVKSTLAEMRERGAHGVSLRLVAARAGCTPMATYRHFSSKEALMAEIAREGFVFLKNEIDEVIKNQEASTVDLIAGVGEKYIRMALKSPEHLLMMFGGFVKKHGEFAELRAAGDAAFFTLVDLMKKGQEDGTLPKGDAVKQAVAAWSIVHGFSMLLVNGNLEFLGIDVKNYERHAWFVTRSILAGLENI